MQIKSEKLDFFQGFFWNFRILKHQILQTIFSIFEGDALESKKIYEDLSETLKLGTKYISSCFISGPNLIEKETGYSILYLSAIWLQSLNLDFKKLKMKVTIEITDMKFLSQLCLLNWQKNFFPSTSEICYNTFSILFYQDW